MTVPLELQDEKALLDAAAAHVRLLKDTRQAEAMVVRLARRIVREWSATDEEAIRAGGALAVQRIQSALVRP